MGKKWKNLIFSILWKKWGGGKKWKKIEKWKKSEENFKNKMNR